MGGLKFYNARAEAWWKFREELNPDREGGAELALPDDPELLADLTARRQRPIPRCELDKPAGLDGQRCAQVSAGRMGGYNPGHSLCVWHIAKGTCFLINLTAAPIVEKVLGEPCYDRCLVVGERGAGECGRPIPVRQPSGQCRIRRQSQLCSEHRSYRAPARLSRRARRG
jgi:hypothetical protein